MNTKKRQRYNEQMDINGIDTLSGYIDGKVTKEELQMVGDCVKQCNYKVDKDKTYLLVNPNKHKDSPERLITTYSEFLKKLNWILSLLGIQENGMDIIRTDFCFNSDDTNCFEDYQKLHRLLIMCLAITYNLENCYETYSLLDYKKLSIAIKKDTFEIENYDKERQSNGMDECCNRLEIRSKRMSNSTIEEQFLDVWFERLDNAIESFEKVQQFCNMQLERLYKNDLKKPKNEREYLSLNAFLMQYQSSIYSSRQMVDLVSRFDEVRNPVIKARKFKERHKIEYFSMTDLKHIVKMLKRKLKLYFKS